MKKFAFVAVAFIFAAPSFAKWQMYGGMKIPGSGEIKYYYDTDSVSDNGKLRRIWVMEDGLNYDVGGPKGVFSGKYHYEFDCDSKHFRSIQGVSYGAPMGGGNVVSQDNRIMEWLKIFPDNDLVKVEKFVCRRQ